MRNVEHGLDQLLLVAPEFGQRQIVIAHDFQAVREFGQDQATHTLEHFVDVHVADDLRTAMRCQQAIDQRLQAIGFLDDHLRVFAQVLQALPRQFKLQQLRRAADATERILDLVRQIADQLLVGLRLVEDALFAIELDLLHILAQLDQHRIVRIVNHGQHHVQVQRTAPDAFEHEVFPFLVELPLHGLPEDRRKLVTVDEQVLQALLVQDLEGTLQHGFGRGIGIGNATLGVENQDGRRKHVEAAQRSGQDVEHGC